MTRTPKHPANEVSPHRSVESLIHVVRGKKVMLDRDLAALYGVETRALTQAVRRNAGRFPNSFMFQLSPDEAALMRSQIVIASKRNVRFQPLAFTEHGVVMLSAVLNNVRAVEMSILVVEAFVRMRQIIEHNKDIAARVEKLERSHDRSASVIQVLVEDIDRLAHEAEMKAIPPATKRKIGFDL